MLLRNSHTRPRRRGVVLLVVLAMLTLFAVVGLTFVYYAESEANQAANQKQCQTFFLQSPASSMANIHSASFPIAACSQRGVMSGAEGSVGSSSWHRVDDRHASQPFRASSTPMQRTNVVRSRRLQTYELPTPLQGLLCAARFGEVLDLLQGSESRRYLWVCVA